MNPNSADITPAPHVPTSPPALIEMLSYNLNKLALYLRKETGDAHNAFRTWKRRAPKLSNEVVREIKNIASSQHYERLYELIQEHTNPSEVPE
jgi:hypothetical protein